MGSHTSSFSGTPGLLESKMLGPDHSPIRWNLPLCLRNWHGSRKRALLLLWSRSFWYWFRIGYTLALLLQVHIAGWLMHLCRKSLGGQYSIERNGGKVIFKIGSSTEVLIMGSLAEDGVPENVEFLGHGVVNPVLFGCRVTEEDASRWP